MACLCLDKHGFRACSEHRINRNPRLQHACSRQQAWHQADPRSSLTQDDRSVQYTYDFYNNLSQTIVSAGKANSIEGTHTFQYDGFGRRVAKVAAGATPSTTVYVSKTVGLPNSPYPAGAWSWPSMSMIRYIGKDMLANVGKHCTQKLNSYRPCHPAEPEWAVPSLEYLPNDV